MTTYFGTLFISGHLTDDLGDSYTLGGTTLVTSRMTLLAGGQVAMSTDYNGALSLNVNFYNGASTGTIEPFSQLDVTSTVPLASFNLPVGPLQNGIGGTFTETDSFNTDRTMLAVAYTSVIHEVDDLTPYGYNGTITLTGTVTISGHLTTPSVVYTANLLSGANEGNSGATPFVFSVTRTGNTSEADSVAWSVAGSGTNAANAADFVGDLLPSGIASFAAGQTTQNVTVYVAGDTVPEPDEGFTLNLAESPTATAVVIPTLGSASAVIRNDDPMFYLVNQVGYGFEDSGPGSHGAFYQVARSPILADKVTVDWHVVGFGAHPADAADFLGGELPHGTVVLPGGAGYASFFIPFASDLIVEPDETFAVILTNPSSGMGLGTYEQAGIIANDDSALSIAAVQPAQAEDAGPARFVITRNGITTLTTTVQWQVTGNSAHPADAADFVGGVLPSGIATFAPHQARVTIDIPVAADTLFEPDEGYLVTLSNPLSQFGFIVTLGTASAAGEILNDDATPASLAIAATDAVKPEGNSGTTPFSFAVTRSGDTASPVSVAWSVAGDVSGASANPRDFAGGVVPQGTLSFAAGQTSQTITVNVAGDTTVEPDEGFRVVLSAPSIGAVIATASATGSIRNDDTSFAIASTTGSHAEGDSGSMPFVFTVTRSGDVSGSNSVAWATAGMAPNSVGPADFLGDIAPSGTLSFAPGETSQTLTVAVAGDTQVEPDEYLRVALGAATGGASIAVASASAKIVNDDTSFAISATDANKPEGNGGATPFVFTVTRGGNIAGTHSIAWLATGLSPNSVGPADFVAGTAFSGSLLFLPGQTTQTITVDIQGDTQVEPDEHFQVLLRNASAGAAITVNHAEGTVINDDIPAGALTGYALDTGMNLLPVQTQP